MKEQCIEKVDELKQACNGKITPYSIDGKHPKNRMLKPFGIDELDHKK